MHHGNVRTLHRRSGGASVLPRDPHGDFIETGAISALPWTPSSRAEISLSPLHPPSTKGLSRPWNPRPTLRGLDAAILSKMDYDQDAPPNLEP
jgi:hypothetical protein